jgi:hypothetical protein
MRRLNPNHLDNEELPTVVYVIFQKNWGKFEIVGTATSSEEAWERMKCADCVPKSGRVICRKFSADGSIEYFGM